METDNKKNKKIVDKILVILFIALFLVNLIQVFFRYVIGASLSWSEEIARYLFIWATYFGMAIVIRDEESIRIDILELIVKNKSVIRILEFLRVVFTIIISLVLLVLSANYVGSIIDRNLLATATGMPLWIPVSSIIIGSLLSIFYLISKFRTGIFRNQKNSNMEEVK